MGHPVLYLVKMAESLDEVVGGVGGAAPHDGPEDRQERLEGHAVVRPVLVHQLLHLCRQIHEIESRKCL